MNLHTQRSVFKNSRGCLMAVRDKTVQNTNTQLSGNTVSITSGGDNTYKGVVVHGEQVTAAMGGNLNLSSLQDTSQYQDKSQSSGFSVSVPITGGSASASFSHSSTDINSNYQSVGEQTAIRAGDGGFDIDVQGKTTLTGAQITSTQAAIDNNKNSFKSAGGLDMQDLQNTAQFDASSYSVSATVRGDSRNEDGTPRLDAAGKPVQVSATLGASNSTPVFFKDQLLRAVF
ncbi:hemagglutinin repeat-containing protein [Limnohabitans sp.]|uniref:hemagglutinin repeat-containing protein n=1 Tax=Limnohabitans sp. TaxID=1907725 RepID=UPI0025B8C6D8|nr:hemagglutinin repeat-containing protein [Limnohabitans sp.]